MCFYTDNFVKTPTEWSHSELTKLAKTATREARKETKKTMCLVDAFFKDQQKLPANRRQTSCMISCPCNKCKSGTL